MNRRYVRQAAFAPIGLEGQSRIEHASVAIVGVGALGSIVAERLARCGIGRLRLIDRDWVEIDNLPRQSLYTSSDALDSRPKAIAASERLLEINPDLTIEPIVADLTFKNINEVLGQVDCIVDGSDNFEVRFLINDYSHRERIPWVHAGVIGASGQSMTIVPGRTACFRCLMPEPPSLELQQTCDSAGVLGPAVGVIGAWQAIEVIKQIVAPETIDGSLRVFDLWRGNVRTIRVPRIEGTSNCPTCVQHHYAYLAGEGMYDSRVLCGRNSVQIVAPNSTLIDLDKLAARLRPHGELTVNPYLLRFSSDTWTITVFPDGRAVVHGTENLEEARKIYTRWIGG